MTRIDFGGATLALLAGFILSAGITGFLLSANGGQMPMPMPLAHPGIMAGPGMMASAPQAQAPAQVAVAGAPVELKLVATDLKFTPPALQAKVGQPVKIVLENKGMIEHDITFPAIKPDKVLAKPGQTVTLEFTPAATGTFEYICTIPGHKEAGMKGTLTVK